MKKVLIILGIVLLATTIIVAVRYINTNVEKPTATINSQSFFLDIAETPKDKEVGLSKYESLPENQAMLFQFDTAAMHSFWMKDMKFPIDIIFIKDSTIITIHKNIANPGAEHTSLPLYMPTSPANLVLEINAGLSEKYNFKEGDVIKFNNI